MHSTSMFARLTLPTALLILLSITLFGAAQSLPQTWNAFVSSTLEAGGTENPVPPPPTDGDTSWGG